MTQQNEQQVLKTEVETPKEISSDQPSEETSEGTGLQFEDADFAAITDFVELDGEEAPPVEVAAEEEPAPVEETPPEETPAELEVSEGDEAPVVEEPPVVEAEAPVEKEAAPEIPEVEPVKLPTQEELQGLYKEHREKMLPQLSELFTLTDEEAAALDEQPSKMIPQLAGQMMYDTMLSTYNAVVTALPTMVKTFIAADKNAEVAQTKFYDAWPDLNTPNAVPAVSAAIQAYRSANPRAPLEDVIKNAGVMAMINLGKDPMKKETKTEKAPLKPKAPARPVSPGGSTQITPPKPRGEEENEFAKLADLYTEELM